RAAALRVRVADDDDAHGRARGPIERTFDVPGRPGDRLADRARIHRSRLAPHVRRQEQALDDLAALEVRIDDLVDVGRIDVRVPDAFGIDDGHRAAGAAIEATRLVDAHPARPAELLGLDARLAMIEAGLGAVMRARVLTVFPIIEAKEDVPLVVAHCQDSRSRTRSAWVRVRPTSRAGSSNRRKARSSRPIAPRRESE